MPEYLEAAAKSMEGEELAAFERSCRETYDVMARGQHRPDWTGYFDFGAGRFARRPPRADLQGRSREQPPSPQR